MRPHHLAASSPQKGDRQCARARKLHQQPLRKCCPPQAAKTHCQVGRSSLLLTLRSVSLQSAAHHILPAAPKKPKLVEQEGGVKLADVNVFCPGCGQQVLAVRAAHWGAGYVAPENTLESFSGRCTNCGCSFANQRMTTDFGGGGNMLAWLPRATYEISAAANQSLQEQGRASANHEYRCQVFADPALEVWASMWMRCPVCGNELQAPVMQVMPTTKTKLLGQWVCPGCPFEAHGCLMRIGEHSTVSWTVHEK